MNLGWNDISSENRDKIAAEIINHIEEGNHVCRVGWACNKIMKRDAQPNVLHKLAARVTENGEYTMTANKKFEYDFDIKRTPVLDLEQKQLDIKTKRRQLKWFYPLLIISIGGVFITGVAAFINFKNLELQKDKVKYLEDEVRSLKQSALQKQ